jgi:hypothetical protein
VFLKLALVRKVFEQLETACRFWALISEFLPFCYQADNQLIIIELITI